MNVPLSPQEKINLLYTKDLYGVMQKLLLRENKISSLNGGTEQKKFWIIGLSKSYEILFIESINSDNLTSNLIEPIEVFSLALQKRAAHLVLCHNNPNGDLTPSETDKDITNHLIQIGLIVNTPILDHHIISTQDYLSFENIDLMKTLRKNLKYVPSFEAAQRIRAEAAAIMKKRDAEYQAIIQGIEQELQQEKKRAERAEEQLIQEKISTAKKMKKKGIAIPIIAEITGLSIEELGQL